MPLKGIYDSKASPRDCCPIFASVYSSLRISQFFEDTFLEMSGIYCELLECQNDTKERNRMEIDV